MMTILRTDLSFFFVIVRYIKLANATIIINKCKTPWTSLMIFKSLFVTLIY